MLLKSHSFKFIGLKTKDINVLYLFAIYRRCSATKCFVLKWAISQQNYFHRF